jgi:hypothetical protein
MRISAKLFCSSACQLGSLMSLLVQLFVDELDPTNATSGQKDEWDAPAPSAAPAAAARPAQPPSQNHSRQASPVPVRQQRAAQAAATRGAGGGGNASGLRYEESTVDETDFESLAREGRGIARNLRLVCNPLIKQDEVTAMLQHWDLWGPLVRHSWPRRVTHPLNSTCAFASSAAALP